MHNLPNLDSYRAIVTEFRETEETTALRNTITMRLRKIVLMFTMHRKATRSKRHWHPPCNVCMEGKQAQGIHLNTEGLVPASAQAQ